jgi:hypothetical protein
MYLRENEIPKCEDDGCEMLLAGPSLDTNSMYWYCPTCGWSWDDPERLI